MARDVANVLKRQYKVMHRTPEAFSVPADLTSYNTFLATFTDLGYCRDKTIKLGFVKAEEEPLDTGKKKTLSYNGTLEGLLNQATVADYTAYEAIEGIEQDLLLVSHQGDVAIFLPNAILTFEEAVEGGGVETVPFKYELEGAAQKSDFRTRFAIPTS